MNWLPWSPETFARARAERKPVLLSITATWSRGCRDMDETSYADPSVVALANEVFVPVRVDADERPDISERYSLGGWPTTAFLTGDGHVVGGGTYVPVDRMAIVLDQAARTFRERRDDFITPVSAPAETAEEGVPQSEDALRDLVFSRFDPEHGGFDVEPKFPHAAPIRLALDRYRADGDPQMRDIAVTTLDAMGWSSLYDEVDGGFFRYAATRDWRLAHHEKLLAVNASLLSLYAHAADVLQLARFGERAQDVLRYVQTWLADVDAGGWFASQQADERYYSAAAADERQSMGAPPVDDRLFADGNAAMVSAALEIARLTDDTGLREFAIKSLERVVLGCYRPGGGVSHRAGGPVRGLLEDQIAMATAHLDAFETTGNIVYEMMAEELAHYAVRTMWDEAAGGFFDRIHDAGSDVGLLCRRVKPFVPNCNAVRMLRRLAATSGESQFAAYAEAARAAMAGIAPSQGPLAAHYLLAVQAV